MKIKHQKYIMHHMYVMSSHSIDSMWVPGVIRGDIKEYLDVYNIEIGADLQGGTHQSVLDICKVSVKGRIPLLEEILDQGPSEERPGRGPQEGRTLSIDGPRGKLGASSSY